MKLQKHRKLQKERKQKEIDKLAQGQHSLEEEFNKVAAQKEMLTQQLNDNTEKQTNLFVMTDNISCLTHSSLEGKLNARLTV